MNIFKMNRDDFKRIPATRVSELKESVEDNDFPSGWDILNGNIPGNISHFKILQVEHYSRYGETVVTIMPVATVDVEAEVIEDPEAFFRPQIEAHWKTLPITVRDPDLLTDKQY